MKPLISIDEAFNETLVKAEQLQHTGTLWMFLILLRLVVLAVKLYIDILGYVV